MIREDKKTQEKNTMKGNLLIKNEKIQQVPYM